MYMLRTGTTTSLDYLNIPFHNQIRHQNYNGTKSGNMVTKVVQKLKSKITIVHDLLVKLVIIILIFHSVQQTLNCHLAQLLGQIITI